MRKNQMEKGSPGLWKGSKSITLINRYLFFVGTRSLRIKESIDEIVDSAIEISKNTSKGKSSKFMNYYDGVKY